jgi:predicted RNA-binding protein associated with RNAse of E/G family
MIKEYIKDLLLYFRDVRVKKNIEQIVETIIISRHLRVYSMATDKKEYDVFKGLLNGNQKNTLSAESVLEVIRSQAQERLGK